MRKFMLAVWVVVFTFSVWAVTDVPALTGRVVDSAGIFPESDRRELTEQLEAFERITGGQMAVLTVPTLDGEPIEDFSIRVAEAWKLGYQGKDNGILLLIVPPERQMRLEVGYGWEHLVTDARAGDVIRAMVPGFREKQYAQAVAQAIRHLQGFIGTGNGPTAKDGLIFWGILAAFVTAVGWSVYKFGKWVLKPQSPKEIRKFSLKTKGGSSYSCHSGGFGGGGFRGGGGGGFSGGGGGFGGGGASGRW